MRKDNKFYLLMEYGVGGEIDHDKMDFIPGKRHNSSPWHEYRIDHMDFCKKIGICNGFRVWNDVCKERVQHAMEGGFACLIEIWMPAGHWVEWAARRGMKAQEMVDGMVDFARELVKKNPDSVWVNTFAENDNEPWQSLKFPAKTKAELYETLKNYFAHDDFWNMDGKSGVPCKVQGNPFDYLKKRGVAPSEINMVTLYCREFSPHLLYELGAEFAWPEGNVGSNNQIAIAFVRGAASQYDKQWIYDTALFDCQGSEIPTAYDSKLRRFSGFSEDYMLNAWMLSYVSGVKTFLFQSADICFFMRKDTNSLSLSPAGEIAKDFADFTLRNHTDRGEPCVPIAIMLPRDHGYATCFYGSSRIFWGKVPNDAANSEIEGFFRLAFPGCHETHGFSFDANAWAPGGSREKQQPWSRQDIKDSSKEKGERAKAFHEVIANGFDQRPLEKGFITESTWGDSFDVLVDNASSEAIGKYKGVILMGGCKIDAGLRKKLTAYVKNGGRLFLNMTNVGKEDEELLGVKLSGEEGVNFYHTHSVLTNRVFDDGHFKYEKIILAKADPVLYCGHFGDSRSPIVTRNKYGKGEVWFTAAYFNQGIDKYDLSWLESSKEAADEFIRPLVDVEVFGKPVHWTLNKTGKGYWVSIFNNSTEIWSGRLLLKNVKGCKSVRDIWSEKTAAYELDEQNRIVLKLEIEPWKFKIIEIVK